MWMYAFIFFAFPQAMTEADSSMEEQCHTTENDTRRSFEKAGGLVTSILV